MAANTLIAWADHTYNHWIGCTQVSRACDACYAKADFQDRRGRVSWGPGQPRSRTKTEGDLLRWNRAHDAFFAVHGRRQRVFINSLADVFDNEVPDEWRAQIWALCEQNRNLDKLIPTKRIGNVKRMVPAHWLLPGGWPADVRLGITVEDQAVADRDVIKLLEIDCPNFISAEPLLGPLDLTGEYLKAKLGAYPFKGLGSEHRTRLIDLIDWVIVGGESGPMARPMHPNWARDLRDQCLEAGTAFFFKQWGGWWPICQHGPDAAALLYRSRVRARKGQDQAVLYEIHGRQCKVPTLVIHEDGSAYDVGTPHAFKGGVGAVQTFKVGKKLSGTLLDGREWLQTPPEVKNEIVLEKCDG